MVYHGLNDKRLKTITFPFNNGTHPTYYIPAEASDLINNSSVSGETVKDALDTLDASSDILADDIEDLGKSLVDTTDIALSAYVTDTASGTVATFHDGAGNVPIKSLSINVEPAQKGSGDPSPTNIRHITGYTGCNVTVIGKNLCSGVEQGNYTATGVKQDTSVRIRCKDYIPIDENKEYIVSGYGTFSDLKVGILYFAEKGEHDINETAWEELPYTFTPPSNSKYILLVFREFDGDPITPDDVEDIQLEEGSTDTNYEEYHATTYHISFPSSAGTIYGGNVIINQDGSKILSLTKGFYVFSGNSSEMWKKDSTFGFFYIDITFDNQYTNASRTNFAVSNKYVQVPYSNISYMANNKFCIGHVNHYCRLAIKDGRFSTVNKFKEELAANNLEICYNLLQPINIPFTEEETSIITSLYGTNNVYSDVGKVSLEYLANSKLYSDKKIAEDRSFIAPGTGESSVIINATYGTYANTASATWSYAEGYNNRALALCAHVEGGDAIASGDYSHAEGSITKAQATAAHAEGYQTTASGTSSHAEGSTTSAFAASSHAEGSNTTASGANSHVEGQGSSANGSAAHAEGISTKAVGNASHAEGTNTAAQTKSQHVFGEYNIADTGSAAARGTYVEIVGNGTGSSAKSNARTLDWSGNEWLAGNLTAGGGSITVGQTTFTEAQLLAMANGQGQSQAQGSGRITVYCWGDSLTEGVGAYVMQPDNRNAYMAYSYPAWLGQSFDVVNLGARGEDINAIMARQGADPIIIQTSFTIPAGADTPVKIGELSRMLTYGAGTGLTSKSGALVKINKEVESPGLNPCVIADVEGIIYRELKSSTDDNTTYDYYFRRLEDGTAVTVPVGTEVETYAMRNYRNGYAVIWMGANGGYTSHQDFANKVLKMVEYGNYNDYIVILAREFAAQWVPDIKALLTDEMGVCHVIYLMDQLPYRGYAMAGISSNNIDTSNWVTTDPIKKNAPLLCDYISSQSNDEDKYGALHFSAWGYKAIAKLVQEKLMPMIKVAENSGGGSGEGGGSSTTGTDSYGTYLYKLPAPRTFNGTTYLNTKLKLYEDVSSEWTVVCKYSGALSTDDAPGYPVNVLCCMPDGNNQGILLRYTSASDAMVVLGAGAFPLGPSYDNNTSINFDQTNVIIIVKFENTYKFYCNNTVCAYNGALGPNGYDLSSDKAHDLPLIFGARWNHDGSIANYRTKFTLEDARVYEGAMAESDVIDLYYELTQ